MTTGLLSLVIGGERLVSAILVDGATSYTSTRVIVGVSCIASGAALAIINAIARRPHHRA
jgi:hypothetical protein